MILSCPNCNTRFLLDASRLGRQGRTVRCARCNHTWFAAAPAEDDTDLDPTRPVAARPSDPEDTEISKTSPSSNGYDDERDFKTDPISSEPNGDGPAAYRRRFQSEQTPDRSNLPALQSDQRLGKMLGWGGLALFLTIVVGGILLFPRQITAAWPPAHTLYATLGVSLDPSAPAAQKSSAPLPLDKRLSFSGLTPSQRFIDGVLTLVITGEIRNIGDTAQDVPLIEVVLLDGKKLDLKTWVFATEQKVIDPGKAIPFETKLENPPAEAQDIRVTFVAGAN